MKKRTAILGGSFDPIHNGHLSIAEAAVNELRLDRLLLMPAFVSPFKQGRTVADEQDRLEMARLAARTIPNASASDYEIRKQSVSYTYDTLDALDREGTYGTLIFLTGTDAFLDIETWYRGEELLRRFAFGLAPRPDTDRNEEERKLDRFRERYGADITVLHNRAVPVSSTEIREKVAAGVSITGLVPADVEGYIYEHGLYRSLSEGEPVGEAKKTH